MCHPRCRERISIHAPRVGSDDNQVKEFLGQLNFNPRSPCGERHNIFYADNQAAEFQSTLPVWGATTTAVAPPTVSSISIHAPRVGSDCQAIVSLLRRSDFNPRSPCGERPRLAPQSSPAPKIFQSTLPVWGATGLIDANVSSLKISIHAPRVGSDPFTVEVCAISRIFQSTLPVWGATRYSRGNQFWAIFQSTLPVWGATSSSCLTSPAEETFQSTLPVWGATRFSSILLPYSSDFNPRSPCGERRACYGPPGCGGSISIHAPRVGSDSPRRIRSWIPSYFNPRSPCGERRSYLSGDTRWLEFQSTLPVWGATGAQQK